MAGSAQKGYSLRNKALAGGGVIVVFFRQNSVSIGELLQGMEQQLFGNENERVHRWRFTRCDARHNGLIVSQRQRRMTR
jgi:hypothetical protein